MTDVFILVTGFLTLLGTQFWMAYLLREMRRESAESLQALMHGQEHIAELVAEVLRRTRP
jgi:hypothetical protein